VSAPHGEPHAVRKEGRDDCSAQHVPETNQAGCDCRLDVIYEREHFICGNLIAVDDEGAVANSPNVYARAWLFHTKSLNMVVDNGLLK
jgi:hypothetical protein